MVFAYKVTWIKYAVRSLSSNVNNDVRSNFSSITTIKFAETQRDRYAPLVDVETMALKRVKHWSLQ